MQKILQPEAESKSRGIGNGFQKPGRGSQILADRPVDLQQFNECAVYLYEGNDHS